MPPPNPDRFLPLTPVTYHVLLAVADRALHGYGIIKEIADRTDGRMVLEAGTLYAAIKRLVDDALLETASAPPANVDQRRRYYRLTRLGRRVLQADSERMLDLLRVARHKNVLPAR